MEIWTYKGIDPWLLGRPLNKDRIVPKQEAHERGLLHLSTHLLVIGEDGKILCRKRAGDDICYAGLWTTTIGTHVPLEQGYEGILKEYFPLKDSKFEWVGEFRVRDQFENEVNGLHVVRLSKSELDDSRFLEDKKFFTPSELEELILGKQTTPHLTQAYSLLSSFEH